ncbi:MAG: VIT1/CCC1 family predicted Fe2+/Mn2+ transporter [Patescibacteria group bacterium]|jgi:VIT1/CCC1 family predicted Fe2+/Mn2+ transporter
MFKKVKSYLGSVVLGLNDALVELTGILAGLTLALADTRIILITGFVAGFAACLSMAASEYLSRKAEVHPKHKGEEVLNPVVAASYTGLAYFVTVLFLLVPYLFMSDPLYALFWALGHAVIVILIYTYYSSSINGNSFVRSFLQMFFITFGVAAVSFILGYLLRYFFMVEI